MSPPLHSAPLVDRDLPAAIAFLRSANPFAQHTWGWDAGRFIDWRWGNNTARDAAEPGFFERHGTVVRRGDDIVALVVSEVGSDDHCVLTGRPDPETLEWAFLDLRERRPSLPLVMYPSDGATWVHEVIERYGFAKGEVAGLEWGYDLDDIPGPTEPEGFAIESIRGPEDYPGIALCLEGAFGGSRDRIPILTSLATNPMYVRDLWVIARASNGDIAAYCKGEVDPDSGVAAIDPVATRPDYQRRGLGRAVILRCFSEQRRLGGTMSYIGSGPAGSAGSHLYRQLNPVSMTCHSEWSYAA